MNLITNTNIYLKDVINLRDGLKNKGVHPIGRVIAYVPGTNKVLFDRWNKVLVAGSAYLASQNFNLTPPVQLPTYNTDLGLENTIALSPTELKDRNICLFAVGTDGCGQETSQVYDVNYSKRIEPTSLIPFQIVSSSSDLSADNRDIYFGRKIDNTNSKILYYFKSFDTTPVIKQEYIDGTSMDEAVYSSDNTTELRTYVEMKMSNKPTDCKTYFEETVGISEAKVNSISLLTGLAKTYNGYTYYQGIEPFTRLNFSSIPLSLEKSGVNFIYQLYY